MKEERRGNEEETESFAGGKVRVGVDEGNEVRMTVQKFIPRTVIIHKLGLVFPAF